MIRSNSKPVRIHSPRRAAIIVFVLIALLVATFLSAELVRMAGLSHRLIKQSEWMIQANRLADAASARTLVLIDRDPQFMEEEWKIPANQLPAGQAAIVRIKVNSHDSDPVNRIISIVAEYPINHPDVVRATRELRIPR